MFDRIRFRLRAVFRPSALEREMHDEMEAHLDRRVDILVAQGMNPDVARLAARREFGNVGLHQEHARDARRTAWIDAVRTDVRFALRSFVRRPFMSITIVLVLALGIGAHAFELTAVRAFTSRRAPGMSDDVELVRLRGMWRPKDQTDWWPLAFSYPELHEISELPNTFVSVAAWTKRDVVLDAAGALDRATGEANFVTDGFFDVLGLRPTHGAGLPSGSRDPQLVAVISHAMWRDVFDGAEDIASRALVVNGVRVRIVGVAPPLFVDPVDEAGRRVLWMPLSARTAILGAGQPSGRSVYALSSVDSTLFEAVGVLRRDVTPQEATARVRVAASRAVARMAWPAMPNAAGNVYDADVVPLRGNTNVGSDWIEELTIFGTVTTLVLLIAITNVSGLVVSAGVVRRQEIAIRLSLGASRARVIQQLLTESGLLALGGGAIGLLLYAWIIAAIVKRQPDAAWFAPDYTVVAFTMCVALTTGVLCGLAPALHATRRGVSETLKGDSAGAMSRSRLQHAFVVAQVAFTQPLLVLVGGMIWSVLADGPPTLPDGIPERVLRVSFRAVPGTPAERSAALERVEKHIAELPGVVQVLGDIDPQGSATFEVHRDDRGTLPRASMPVHVDVQLVRPGYFSMLNAPLLRGNDVPPTDSSRTMTISSDLARELWGGADPIGRRFVQTSSGIGINRVFTVTGVYDTRYLSKGREGRARVFRPTSRWWPNSYLIRTVGRAADISADVRRVLREELPVTPIGSIMTLADVEAASANESRMLRAGATASGVIVLMLASLGLYGVVALAVAQRRREIGVRMAIGARATQVVQLFYVRGLTLGVLGLLLGLPATLAIMALEGDELVRGSGLVLVGGIVATVVLVVASIATLLPASRATRVDPVTALRSE
jgi:predicted permease